MRGKCTAISILLALGGAPPAEAGVRGDAGWSADSSAWGWCDAWILPDSTAGCRFFGRESRRWIEVGRREALEEWRPWEPEMSPTGTRPMIPVHPMQEDEGNPGPVRLLGRLVPSDDVIEIWRLEGDVEHGVQGGEWATVFDYSPDGTWLAAGAVHVDHETSRNELSVEVRPVAEWLALANNRLAVEDLAAGRIRSAVRHLARARRCLEAPGEVVKAGPPIPASSPLEGVGYADPDPLHELAFAGWSGDGERFCACDAWREAGEDRARCRITEPPFTEWKPVLVSLIHMWCPGVGKPRAQVRAPIPYRFVADGGFDGKIGSVAVYMTGGALGPAMGAVVEKGWEEPATERDRYPAFFHAVGLPSPDGAWIAVGYLQESGDEYEKLRHVIEVRRSKEWTDAAAADIRLDERASPPSLDDLEPAVDLPAGGKGPAATVAGPVPGSGCGTTLP